MGRVLRQRAVGRGRHRVPRLAGDRSGGRGGARGPLRGGARLPPGTHAPGDRRPGGDSPAQADGRGRGLAVHAGPRRAELPGRGGEDVAEKERRARARDPVRRDGDAGGLGASRVDPDQAVPRQPRTARGGRCALSAERVGDRPDPGTDPKRELYLRRPDEAAVLRLEVDPESYWLYTSSPLDVERRAEAVAKHGLVRGLEVLAGRTHPTPSTERT